MTILSSEIKKGTGNYGIAIGKRFLKFGGFRVIFGSRNPNKDYLQECLNSPGQSMNYEVTTIKDAWNLSQKVVF